MTDIQDLKRQHGWGPNNDMIPEYLWYIIGNNNPFYQPMTKEFLKEFNKPPPPIIIKQPEFQFNMPSSPPPPGLPVQQTEVIKPTFSRLNTNHKNQMDRLDQREEEIKQIQKEEQKLHEELDFKMPLIRPISPPVDNNYKNSKSPKPSSRPSSRNRNSKSPKHNSGKKSPKSPKYQKKKSQSPQPKISIPTYINNKNNNYNNYQGYDEDYDDYDDIGGFQGRNTKRNGGKQYKSFKGRNKGKKN